MTQHIKKPEWLKIKLPDANEYAHLKGQLRKHHLHTICESGLCPNIGECWKAGTATFMILGDICTRACKFCAVKTGKPLPPDSEEPQHIAEAVRTLNLKHCVLTSVDRDDLSDGGARIWAETIRAIKKMNPEITIECLVPDFNGQWHNLDIVIEAKPEIISHNLETVKRLTKDIRIHARYELSLEVVRRIGLSGIVSKSGIMTGLGETNEEIYETMNDLRQVDCRIFTIGQYLQPSHNNYPVKRYVTPQEFESFKKTGLEMGFSFVESGPLVRSSFHAEKHV